MSMSDENDLSEPQKKLSDMLTVAGYKHDPASGGARTLRFTGRYRNWMFFASANADWFHVHTYICELPPEPGLRSELLLWLARANSDMALLKYSVNKSDHVVLECEVRFERLEAGDVSNVIGFLHSVAERDYLALLRVASGEQRLAALEGALGPVEAS